MRVPSKAAAEPPEAQLCPRTTQSKSIPPSVSVKHSYSRLNRMMCSLNCPLTFNHSNQAPACGRPRLKLPAGAPPQGRRASGQGYAAEGGGGASHTGAKGRPARQGRAPPRSNGPRSRTNPPRHPRTLVIALSASLHLPRPRLRPCERRAPDGP